jgi:ABC-type oligopeptide transport system ATPase subunit
VPDRPEGRIRLQARGLAKRFESRGGGVQALDGLDLEVADGEFVSVIGPSGCGKSTLFNLLAGLEAPSAGPLFLDGDRCDASRLLGRVELALAVDLPRPRSYELITTEPFVERKQLLLEHLGMTLPPREAVP